MKTLILLSFLITVSAYATEVDSTIVPRPDMHAIRTQEPIVIDGILSETVWQYAPVTSDLLQRNPNEGSRPTEKTEVRIVYDDNAIYVSARMFDSAPDSIIARLARRDAEQSSDDFLIAFDAYDDHQTGFYFGLNAAGAYYDGVLYNDDFTDGSWDGVWEGKATIDSLGWCAEMRIPFSQLRFHNTEKQLWGIDFLRDVRRKNEEDYLVFTPKNGSGFVSRFTHLLGIENVPTSHQIEIMPYITTRAEYIHYPAGDPFHDGSKLSPDAGLDMKVGLGSNLTLTGTINPDFGQVEVDPAVVNLSDVETFYQEKRPFFIEGATIFNFGYGGATSFWNFNFPTPNFFYTRRIGRAPHGELPDADYTDVPAGTKILGAAKLTGKIYDSWNFGTIQAVTGREFAQISNSGANSRLEVEPPTYYGIIRGQREFDDSHQGIGFMTTSTIRSFADDRLKADMNSSAHTLGIDGWTFFDSDKTWVLSGWTQMSYVRGTTEQMISLQENSQHYFQRPDAKSYTVDSSATSMTGYAGRLLVNKQKGNIIFNSSFGIIDPKFDDNDLGFLSRTDIINMHMGGGYRWTDPESWFRNAGAIGAGFQSFNFDGNVTWRGVFTDAWVTLLNYYYIEWVTAYNPITINTRRTRGGPLSLNPRGYQTNLYVNSDNRKLLVFNSYFNAYVSEDSKDWNGGVSLTWHPAPNISFTLGPDYSRNIENTQWVGVFDDPVATATFGKRYVFGKMDQTTISANIRLDWTFTPQLSLQLFLQPLISAGDFLNFKELSRPRSYDLLIYGTNGSTISKDGESYTVDPDGSGPASTFTFDNPQYNYTSIRGNAVLRWEYMPGSVLYFVWTQSRSNNRELGDFNFGPSADKLWHMMPDNIFMVKMSYWWNK